MECTINSIRPYISVSGFNKYSSSQNNLGTKTAELYLSTQKSSELFKNENSKLHNLLFSKINQIKNFDPDNNLTEDLIQTIKRSINQLQTVSEKVFFQFSAVKQMCEKPCLLKEAEYMTITMNDTQQGSAQRLVLNAYLNLGKPEDAETLFEQMRDPKQKRFSTFDLASYYISTGRLKDAESLLTSLKDSVSEELNLKYDFVKINAQCDLIKAYIKEDSLKEAAILAFSVKDITQNGFALDEVIKAYLDKGLQSEAIGLINGVKEESIRILLQKKHANLFA